MTVSAAVAVAPQVADALADGRPVVALESAIITHGLPRPRNLEVASEMEALLDALGVVPATVAVVDGVPTVGLDSYKLERLAAGAGGAGRNGAEKASLRDLPPVVARGACAGTTVAATAWLARAVGIRVFATGGIGGVHRRAAAGTGAEQTFDESADLPVLARTSITVVSAGVKSILDVAATLERLETLGVILVGYRTQTFPGFYVRDSGHTVATSVSGPHEVVAIMAAADKLGFPGAIVVANPVPESEQLDPSVHDAAIADAMAAAWADGVQGPAITPYLLNRLVGATGGASLEANVAAVRSNVAIAAGIARTWSAHGTGQT